VDGDFLVTTDVEVSQRGGTGAPRSTFSLGGLMVRAPRAITPATWTPGGENYVFLSAGAGDTAGAVQLEVQTTLSSVSTLSVTPGASHVTLRVARIGPYVITLRQLPGGAWTVHRRFTRADLPSTLQVGLTSYTDYPTCAAYTPFDHNRTVIHSGHPDLVAAFDYLRFARPHTPANVLGRNLADPADVSDDVLLAFLGAAADGPPPAPPAGITTIHVTDTVQTPSVKRFGINLGWINAYDTGQVRKELVFRNPGFEGLLYQSIVRCASGDASTCVDSNTFSAWPTGFWDGASYEVIWGAAKDRAGVVATSTAHAGAGMRFAFADAGPAIGAGDYLVLRRAPAGSATDGWAPQTFGGGAVSAERMDLAPDAAGTQAVRLAAATPGQYAALSTYFDSSTGQTFVQLNGHYRLSFKARGVGGPRTSRPYGRPVAPSALV